VAKTEEQKYRVIKSGKEFEIRFYPAAIRFSGYASDDDIRVYSEKLRKLLIENKISYYGNFRYLGYDSPFRLTGRRNEIIVSVKWEN
jgi:hypothetical protein